MKLTETDMAWCAGVIDSMGLIKTRTVQTGSELGYVAVSTANSEVVNRLSKLTGIGVITVHRDYKRLGCGEHCTEAHLHVFSVTMRWSLTGARAVVFLNAIEPYLVCKQTMAKRAIAAGMTAPSKPATLRKMYSLGWPEVA